jgi:hypothetical protein
MLAPSSGKLLQIVKSIKKTAPINQQCQAACQKHMSQDTVW